MGLEQCIPGQVPGSISILGPRRAGEGAGAVATALKPVVRTVATVNLRLVLLTAYISVREDGRGLFRRTAIMATRLAATGALDVSRTCFYPPCHPVYELY
jgi:hypothetical protein